MRIVLYKEDPNDINEETTSWNSMGRTNKNHGSEIASVTPVQGEWIEMDITQMFVPGEQFAFCIEVLTSENSASIDCSTSDYPPQIVLDLKEDSPPPICPAGRYGITGSSSNTDDCLGVCIPGEYCPEGTIASELNMCSQTHSDLPKLTISDSGEDNTYMCNNDEYTPGVGNAVCVQAAYDDQNIEYCWRPDKGLFALGDGLPTLSTEDNDDGVSFVVEKNQATCRTVGESPGNFRFYLRSSNDEWDRTAQSSCDTNNKQISMWSPANIDNGCVPTAQIVPNIAYPCGVTRFKRV